MRTRWTAIGLVTATFVAVILWLLWQPKNDSRSADINIGVLKHESSLPIYVADQLGLFKKVGVSVHLIELPPGDHMPALLSRRVDIISPTSFPVLFGVMLKNPGLLYAVFPGAEIANGPTVYGLVVSKSSAAHTLDDLRNKIIIAINPYTKVNMETILASAGMPRKEWPQIKVASRDAALKAISDGQADAAIMDQPALAVALASGEYRLLESNPRAKYIGSPYWSGSGAVLVQTWKSKEALFTNVMRAVDAALLEIQRDPQAAHRILAARLGLDQDVADQMGGYYFPMSTDVVDVAAIEGTADALVKAGLLQQAVNLKGLFPPHTYGAP